MNIQKFKYPKKYKNTDGSIFHRLWKILEKMLKSTRIKIQFTKEEITLSGVTPFHLQ